MIETTTVDGVPVFWTTTPGRLSANLYFRVGAADETYGALGISHLIEHLAFHWEEDLDPDSNGSTNPQTTEFWVEGSPEKVVRQLDQICASLTALADGTLPAEAIEREKKVLIAEGGTSLGEPSVGEALTARFGLERHGLAGIPAALLANITVDEVRNWTRTYFTRGNAVLTLTGPPPEGLGLRLPPGVRHPVPDTVDPVPALPGEYISGGDELVLSFAVPGASTADDALAGLVVAVLERRSFRTLRRESGLIYGIDSGVFLAQRDGVFICTVRVKPEHAGEAARAVVQILRDLRDQGLDEAERAAAVQRTLDALDRPQHAEAELYDQAVSHLTGRPSQTVEQIAEQMRVVTRPDVARYLALLDETLLVGAPTEAYPEDAEPGRPGLIAPLLGPVPGPEIRGKAFPVKLMARLAGAPKRLRLTVGEVGVCLDDGNVRQVQVWEDVVALEWGESDPEFPLLQVVGRNGQVVEIPVAALKGGDAAVQLIQEHVPSRLQVLRSASGEGSKTEA